MVEIQQVGGHFTHLHKQQMGEEERAGAHFFPDLKSGMACAPPSFMLHDDWMAEMAVTRCRVQVAEVAGRLSRESAARTAARWAAMRWTMFCEEGVSIV